MSRAFSFLGVLLVMAAQAQGYEYLDDVISRAMRTLRLYKSGRDTRKPVYESHGVALDLGHLNKETFPLLPENLKISIAGCHKLLVKSPTNNYDDILARMMQNPLMQSKEDSFINRQDKFLPGVSSWWNLLAKSDQKKMEELNDWFLRLITDTEFLAATKLDSKSSLSMAKAAMLIFNNLRNECGDGDKRTIERDIINLAVLHYPQAENQTFHLHNVHLWGWVDCASSKKAGGITGEYTSREFTSRYMIISKLSDTSREKALTFINYVFQEIEPKIETTTEHEETTSESSSNKPNLLFTTTAAITTAASISGGNNGDEDDDLC